MRISILETVILGSIILFQVQSAKILSISFVSTQSHKITYEPLLRALARKGHQVTVLSPLPSKDEKNYKNIQTLDMEEVFKKSPNMFELKLSLPKFVEGIFNPYLFMGHRMKEFCFQSYELPEVQKVLAGGGENKYDLIFFMPFFNECLWGLLHKLNTSTILYQPTTVFPWVADKLGTPSPPSFVSSLLVGYSDRMNFLERLWNFVRGVLDLGVMDLYYHLMMEGVYREALGDPSIPSISEIVKNVSLVLTSSHISFTKPRPLMPDIVEVGGLHLVPAKAVVPTELEDFLSGNNKEGFILFSMGSALKGSMMPESYRKMFLSAFSKLKQRVIWKWETETMDDLPPNVKLSKWLPQQDVLGHKNIRLFLTHGGYGSTTEAIYHGVPLVGIPMMGDQPTNMRKASELGLAPPPLDFNTLTEESLLGSINEALNDPRYRENARRLSAIFHDEPLQPLDKAIYWVEYVLRHNGALHLRSAARDLNYFQYFSLDVIAVLLILAYLSFKINFFIFKFLFRKCFERKQVVDSKSKVSKKDSKKKR